MGVDKLVNNISNENTIDSDMIKINKINKKIKYINQYLYIFIKRLFDIMAGLFGVIILIPLTIIIYIIRKIFKEDDGPMFYDQIRIGKNGRHFKLYKFRTMVVGADKILQEYLEKNPNARREFNKNQKLKDDPRITKIGKFLRKTSLDEFPQFINVLKGEMSLIGPRPIVDREVSKFGDKMNIVHSVKPGITGYWAANGRSNTTYEERVNMEVYYAKNCSIKLDLKIIFKTIEAVLKRNGAI